MAKYDKNNAEKWLNEHHFGYYNNEHDKGTGAEEIPTINRIFEAWDDEPEWLTADPVDQDREHANLYGGDREYCDECGRRLTMGEWGGYCSHCHPEYEDYEDEYLDDDDTDSEWELIDRKNVEDSDGFITEYSWYQRGDEHVMVFGDPDLYRPEDGDYDAEFDSEERAREWFSSYEGFTDHNEGIDKDRFNCLEDECEERTLTEAKTYMGIPNTEYIYHGDWADPETRINGKSFNYYDVEEYLWNDYKEHCADKGENPSDEGFAVYCKENGEDLCNSFYYGNLEFMSAQEIVDDIQSFADDSLGDIYNVDEDSVEVIFNYAGHVSGADDFIKDLETSYLGKENLIRIEKIDNSTGDETDADDYEPEVIVKVTATPNSLSECALTESVEDEDKPFTKSQIRDELRRETQKWTKKSDEIFYGFESEYDYALTVLKKHYKDVEGEEKGDRYVIKFSNPNKGLKEGWAHFEFTSGSNPYIAKTEEEKKRLCNKWGKDCEFKGNINGNDYYVINDKPVETPFVDEIDEGKELKESILTNDGYVTPSEGAVEQFLDKYGFGDDRYPKNVYTDNASKGKEIVVSFTDGISASDFKVIEKHTSEFFGECPVEVTLGKEHKDGEDLWATIVFDFGKCRITEGAEIRYVCYVAYDDLNNVLTRVENKDEAIKVAQEYSNGGSYSKVDEFNYKVDHDTNEQTLTDRKTIWEAPAPINESNQLNEEDDLYKYKTSQATGSWDRDDDDYLLNQETSRPSKAPMSLQKKASIAYENSDDEFFTSLSDDELVTLWVGCSIDDGNPYGAAYDDEVYDAIAVRPNSRELFDKSTEIIINKMPMYNLVQVYARYYNQEPDPNKMGRERIVADVLKAIKANNLTESKHLNEGDNISLTEKSYASYYNGFELGEKPLQTVRVDTPNGFAIQGCRIDHDKKTFDRGQYTVGADYTYKSKREYERFIDRLVAQGYEEIPSSYGKLTESHILNEGPGAGYTLEGKIKVSGIETLKPVKYDVCNDFGYRNSYDVTFDCVGVGTIEDFRFNSYYYGDIIDSANIDISTVKVNLWKEGGFEDIEAYVKSNLEDIRDCIVGARVESSYTYGGGYVHSKFDGTVCDIDEPLNNSYSAEYNDVCAELFAMDATIRDTDIIEYVDKAVTGDTYYVRYEVMDRDGEYIEDFEDESDAIEYAKSYPASEVVETTYHKLFNGDIDIEESKTSWENPFDDIEEAIYDKAEQIYKPSEINSDILERVAKRFFHLSDEQLQELVSRWEAEESDDFGESFKSIPGGKAIMESLVKTTLESYPNASSKVIARKTFDKSFEKHNITFEKWHKLVESVNK